MKFFNIVFLSYNNFSLKTYEIANDDKNERIFFDLFDDVSLLRRCHLLLRARSIHLMSMFRYNIDDNFQLIEDFNI